MTATLKDFPAFRIGRGDIMRHNNRQATVTGVEQVVFYPRSRTSGRTTEHGVKLSLRYAAGGRTTVTLRNAETIRAYR